MTRLGFSVLALALLGAPAMAAEPTGEWLVENGDARIRVEPCEAALCGKIAWTREPGGRDKNNPDTSKRDRPVLGMQILTGMKQTAQNRWEGEVYNAENGKTYTSKMSLKSDDVLRIEGCVLGGFICGGQDWTRAKADVVTGRSAARPAK